MRIERFWSMPNSNTFQIAPIRERIQLWRKHVKGTWIEPFAGKFHLPNVEGSPVARNSGYDLTNQDSHKEPLDFLRSFDDAGVAGVIWDAHRKMTEEERAELKRIVEPKGVVFSLGKSSRGVGNKYGFWTELIVLSTAYDGSDDEIMVIERRNEQEYL